MSLRWGTFLLGIMALIVAVAAICLAAVYAGKEHELSERVDELEEQVINLGGGDDEGPDTSISGFAINSMNQGAAGSQLYRNIEPPSGNKRALFTEDHATVNERLISVHISNAVCAAVTSDVNWRSMFASFGQLIDHDLILTVSASTDLPQIVINCTGDPVFGSFADPNIRIDARGRFLDDQNRTQFVNVVTQWLDASFLYGSSESRARELRTFKDGKMKVYPHQLGDLMPINIGQFPQFERNAANAQNGHFCGDIRCSEQPALFALHTVFLRFHNIMCDKLLEDRPEWSDELVYRWVRHTVKGIFQKIVYEEWIPALLGENLADLPEHFTELTGGPVDVATAFAALRFGHTLIPDTIQAASAPYGNSTYAVLESFDLATSFLQTNKIYEYGIRPLILGLLNQDAQNVDSCVVPALQDQLFLNIHPGVAADLLAINIARGREVDLPTFNDMRATLGLPEKGQYSDLTSNATLAATLGSLYQLDDMEGLDLFVGLISEDHMPGKGIGETLFAYFVYQFTRLRDGDPTFYARGRDSGLRHDQLETIAATNFRKVLHYALDVPYAVLPDNVFMKT